MRSEKNVRDLEKEHLCDRKKEKSFFLEMNSSIYGMFIGRNVPDAILDEEKVNCYNKEKRRQINQKMVLLSHTVKIKGISLIQE